MPVLEAPIVHEETKLEERSRDDGIAEALARLAELDLPAEDGIPLESNWHRVEMNLLIDAVHYLWRDRNDYFAGGNMFIYFNLEQARRRDYRGPDVFVVKDVDGMHDRDSWVVWQEAGRYPDVIVELASPSTIDVDLGVKKRLYERTFHTQEYFCYDPLTNRLFGWQLSQGHYADLPPNEQGWLWSEEIGVWLGTWQGEFQRLNATWLRFYTSDGQIVPTLAEAEAQRAEAEAQRAEAEAQRAEKEAQRAEKEAQRAEKEAQRAEAAAQRAEKEVQRAEAEAQRAETAEVEITRLRELLTKHGITDHQK
jgi:Uma2 family endonuclease